MSPGCAHGMSALCACCVSAMQLLNSCCMHTQLTHQLVRSVRSLVLLHRGWSCLIAEADCNVSRSPDQDGADPDGQLTHDTDVPFLSLKKRKEGDKGSLAHVKVLSRSWCCSAADRPACMPAKCVSAQLYWDMQPAAAKLLTYDCCSAECSELNWQVDPQSP